MPDRNDKFEGEQARIWVTGGKYFHLYSDSPNEIDIKAIAAATSRLCRFTGHLRDGIEIYSVAEHSILVSYIVEKMGAPPAVCLQALLHDASEAYLADIAAPFKPAVNGYHDVEDMIFNRIAERYLIPATLDHRVKLADWYALFIEAPQILDDLHEDEMTTWQGWDEHGMLSEKYYMNVQCWLPSMAKIQFLARFAELQDAMLHLDEVDDGQGE